MSVGLLRSARAAAERPGLAPVTETGGGGSDGNITAGLGVPTLDGLGPDGGGAHARTSGWTSPPGPCVPRRRPPRRPGALTPGSYCSPVAFSRTRDSTESSSMSIAWSKTRGSPIAASGAVRPAMVG